MTDTEMLRLLLEEVRAVRADLREHIHEESEEFRAIRTDISSLKEQVAVNKMRLSAITAGIAAVVATIVSYIAKAFTP